MLICSMIPPVSELLSRLDCPEPSKSSGYVIHRNTTSIHPKKKPKLVLQTDILSTNYGVSSSARNVIGNPASTATPTTLNTFTNTFDLSLRPSPNSTTDSPAHSNLILTSCSSPHLGEKVYASNLPYGIKPILKNNNSFLGVQRNSLSCNSASPRNGGRRIFFPAPKKVSFRTVLEEEIVTHQYTARHIDLSSSEDEDSGSDGPLDYSKQNIVEYKSLDNQTKLGELKIPSNGEDVKHEAITQSEAIVSTTSLESDIPEKQEHRRHHIKRPVSSNPCRHRKRRWEWTLASCEDDRDEAQLQAQSPDLVLEEVTPEANNCTMKATEDYSKAKIEEAVVENPPSECIPKQDQLSNIIGIE